MSKKPWRIIPRPLFETILNNHAQHHRVPQPLLLHGPRGVGKTTLILHRLLKDWNKGPHLTGYVDFAESIKDQNNTSFPWNSWSTSPPPALSDCRNSLEKCLESMAEKGVLLGTITSQQIFLTLNKWHGLTAALRSVLQSATNSPVSDRVLPAVLWDRAIFALSARCNANEITGFEEMGKTALSVEEASYLKESFVALKLAKKVIEVQQKWRANAIAHMNRTGALSRTLVHSSTDWPCLLLELLSQAAEIDHFQPKLVINNIEVLKHATLNAEPSSVSGPLYHDSLIWRIVSLGANERCLPVILVTSDSYYSYEGFLEFGYKDLFISRETFGWTAQEAKMHMVTDYFSHSEWTVIAEVLGPNPRHLFELYALKQSNYYPKIPEDKACPIEDIVDAYLAYLQITVVNPAMDGALEILQKFAADVLSGKVSKDRLRFGASWRHPPQIDDPKLRMEWAKLQLIDFVQALVNTEFGVNYRTDYSEEIFDDPSSAALLEVGLLYVQRDPPFIRPISRGIQRCLVRWLVQQRMHLTFHNMIRFLWHRTIRGRYYRHLMIQV
ncbi:putative P-loop containing nucleoside triphosphate hydrolase [Lupinus albus]|uniref:Putative P-loop containing nucleoside triphosphate hydrolase n=1 Tax=Lupinus albus TaxID=3870 RepID=A0A6A4QPG3_LUPAL|nr:putative P-loop containing nucleoside triphosphate hydrolase [Lupinus albus]